MINDQEKQFLLHVFDINNFHPETTIEDKVALLGYFNEPGTENDNPRYTLQNSSIFCSNKIEQNVNSLLELLANYSVPVKANDPFLKLLAFNSGFVAVESINVKKLTNDKAVHKIEIFTLYLPHT